MHRSRVWEEAMPPSPPKKGEFFRVKMAYYGAFLIHSACNIRITMPQTEPDLLVYSSCWSAPAYPALHRHAHHGTLQNGDYY